MFQNVNAHKYLNRELFLHDVELIHVNSAAYNGKDSNFTQTALKILDEARTAIQEVCIMICSCKH